MNPSYCQRTETKIGMPKERGNMHMSRKLQKSGTKEAWCAAVQQPSCE